MYGGPFPPISPIFYNHSTISQPGDWQIDSIHPIQISPVVHTCVYVQFCAVLSLQIPVSTTTVKIQNSSITQDSWHYRFITIPPSSLPPPQPLAFTNLFSTSVILSRSFFHSFILLASQHLQPFGLEIHILEVLEIFIPPPSVLSFLPL